MDVTPSRKRRSRGAAYLAIGCSAAAFVVAAFGMTRDNASATNNGSGNGTTVTTTPATSSTDSFDNGSDDGFTFDSRDFDNAPNAASGNDQWRTPQPPMGSSGGS
jgi:hypothetical protein